MIITCVSILMVDFPLIFPRYNCKAEDYGWAMMDIGVSAVMFASGFSNSKIVQHNIPSKKKKSLLVELIESITQNLGITLAATIRFFLLSGIDYHDHVTEWGVHWNFFVTIALLNTSLVFIRSSKHALLYGILLVLVNEIVQLHWDLKTYIWHAPREDLVTANKEGIISLVGYAVFQLVGMGISKDIYQTLVYEEPKVLNLKMKTKEGLERKQQSEVKAAIKMIMYSVLFWIASEFSYEAFDVPSRRLCNLSWVFY